MATKSSLRKEHFLSHYWLLFITLVAIAIIYLSHSNQWLFYKINALHGYLPTDVWTTLNFLSYSRFFILAIVLLVLALIWRREKLANVLFVIVAYYVVFALLKHVVAEARPYIALMPHSFYWLNRFEEPLKSAHLSFPSGHVGNMAIFVFSLIALFFQTKSIPKILLIILLLLTMLARVCTGWHWPIDVLVSAVLGFLLVKIAFSWHLSFK